MADEHSGEGPSSGNLPGENSDETIELNIKTLDSRIHSFQVDKNMPVLVFKEKVSTEIGVPVGQQRLIFRGKVLKDDHLLSECHVEGGDTLHLVARQSAQSQPSSATSSGEPSVNNGGQGNDVSSGTSRNRAGQISHSVVLGTFNVGDQGEEGVVPDLTRVIGAVLNSFGIGSQMTPNITSGTQSSISLNASGQAPQGNETEGMHSNVSEAGNQPQPGQAFPTQPLQSSPQVGQSPLAGAAVPVPSLNDPISHSLSTLSEFMSRMEQTLSQNGYQPDQSSTSTGDLPTVELPSDAHGLPTPEALITILRHAQRLFSGHTIAALSHIVGRLEQEGTSSDPNVRDQIQTEAVKIGLAMQHLGALLLELGRTILTLRMGQTPAEFFVNSGPAVYISPSGPNPIMVQPFPLQTSSLFGGPPAPPANPVTFAPVGIGNAPRHINIHIHAGTSLAPVVSAVGARVSNGEGTQGERGNGTGSGDSASTGGLPARNVIAAAVPSRLTAEINSRLRNFVSNMQGETPFSSGDAVGNEQLNSMAINRTGGSYVPLPGFEPGSRVQKPQSERNQVGNNEDTGSPLSSRYASTGSVGCSMNGSSKEPALKPEDASENAPRYGEKHDNSEGAKTVPLGLGLGSLERKRRSGQLKSPVKSGDGGTAGASFNHNQHTRTRGQQLWQSIAPRSSAVNRTDSSVQQARLRRIMESRSIGRQGSGRQFDAASVMSQVLQTPALDGLLAGVSEQTGVGSPNVLRDMLQRLTQSPSMRNTVNQIAQQVENEDIGNIFSGLGSGQGGGVDLSTMVQQMMPIVSQALGGASSPPQPFPTVFPESQPQYDDMASRDEKPINRNFKIDLEQVARSIENLNPPIDVFRSIVESAVQLYGDGNDSEDLVDELCSDEGLVNEYIGILRGDVSKQFPGQSGEDES